MRRICHLTTLDVSAARWPPAHSSPAHTYAPSDVAQPDRHIRRLGRQKCQTVVDAGGLQEPRGRLTDCGRASPSGSGRRWPDHS